VTADDGARARGLLDRAIAAKGGLDTLRGIRTIVAVTQARKLTENGSPEAQTTTVLQYPNHVRVETKLPGADVVQVFDGAQGWVKDPNGTHDVPDRMIRDMQLGLRRDTIALLLAGHDGAVRTRVLPDVRDKSGRVRNALEMSSVDLDPIVLLISPETGLIEKQTYIASMPGRPLVEESFEDYQTVDGVQVAFTATISQDGQPVLTRRVTSIRINAPVDPAQFKRPRS
jgi:hypothetical protein